MKLYGVITPGGTASDDEGEDTENCQWLGKYEAETPEEAAGKCRATCRSGDSILTNYTFTN